MEPIIPEHFPLSLAAYGDEDKKEIVQNTRDLVSLWNAHVQVARDGNTTDGIHPPPTMVAMYMGLFGMGQKTPLDDLIDKIADDDSSTQDIADAVEKTQMEILSIAVSFFKFGQFCSANGLLYANMVQCNCEELTDAALQKFLEGTGS